MTGKRFASMAAGFLLVFAFIPLSALAQESSGAVMVPPEIVRLEEVKVDSDGGGKTLTVSGNDHRYHLFCNAKLDSCVTPISGEDYYAFSETTRWQMPGAKNCCATLKFFQDYSVTYNSRPNIALVPVRQQSASFGMYGVLSVTPVSPKTAREYFDELKAANAFKHYADTYVCFADDDVPTFAVIARGSDVIDEMTKAHVAIPKAVIQSKSFLFVQTFNKGVSNGRETYDPVGSDGTSWDAVYASPVHVRMLYSINWETGRYRLSVYSLDDSKVLPADQRYGKCELIHPDVPTSNP